mgnify:FL=1
MSTLAAAPQALVVFVGRELPADKGRVAFWAKPPTVLVEFDVADTFDAIFQTPVATGAEDARSTVPQELPAVGGDRPDPQLNVPLYKKIA